VATSSYLPRSTAGDAAQEIFDVQNSRVQAAERVRLTTEDGERLEAVHLTGPHEPQRPLAVVVAHGFSGSVDRPAVQAVARALAHHAGVVAFDFRGHGRSTGRSTLGDKEILDLDAAVRFARELGYADVVTCGWSMGGSVVLRHAALLRDVDAVVSVSAVSRWFYTGTKPMRRVHWAVTTRVGRFVTRHLLKTRIAAEGWTPVPESPVEVVPAIAPIPLLVVHGDSDHYFPVEHPQALYDAAREPKELWLLEGFGHAENAATPELLERIGAHLPALVAKGPNRQAAR
jgi:pimeloyl-ACP methyl ester carboxylesterase